MNGAETIISCLKAEGVDIVFAYPGATSMSLHHALIGSGIRVVLPRHEQGAAFEACGYARRSGRAGVCIATSGPGATNLVTGIADAWMDSIPLVAITAQVSHALIGKNAFQETDIIGMTRPVVKHSFLALSLEELPEVVKDAFAIARTGRPGPVVVDVPCDILPQEWTPVFPEEPSLRALTFLPDLDSAVVRKLRHAIAHSRRPCIYAGGGVIHSGASALLRTFADKWRLPVTTSLMGIGAFPEDSPLSLKMLGMHGTYAANKAVNECDLLLGLGVRFSDRVTGNIDAFAPNATIVHVDIDASEINKNKHADLAIVTDIRTLLQGLLAQRTPHMDHEPWLRQVAKWKKDFPLAVPALADGAISGQEVVRALSELSDNRCTIVTGVGQNQMWAAQFYSYRRPRQFLSSGGLGAMGFGLPAAIGAQLAAPGDQVVLIDGDGSFQMNIQELATVFAEQLPVKIIILDNQLLGMVAQWEDRFYGGVRANTDLVVPQAHGCYPDFCRIAEGYGIPAQVVSSRRQLRPALRRLLAATGPRLLDCRIQRHGQVMPMIPAGKNCDDIILQ